MPVIERVPALEPGAPHLRVASIAGSRLGARCVLLALVCAANAVADAAAVSGSTLTLRTATDDLGHAVSVPPPPLRIVSLSPGGTEMLFAAGAGNEVIGTVEYSDEPAAARVVPRIGDAAAIDLERLVAMRPDVVVAWPAGGDPAQLAKIARLGVPLYQQQVLRLADLPGSVRRLGVLAGTQAAAGREARELEARLGALQQRYARSAAHATGSGPTVLLQVWNRPIYTIGGHHLMSDALALCGARNVFADLPEPSPLVDIEAVIARNPDIIVAAPPPGEGAAWVAEWQRYATVNAVRHGRVIAFEDQRLSRLGPSLIDATANLCRVIASLNP